MLRFNLLGPLELAAPGQDPIHVPHQDGAVLAVLAHAEGRYIKLDDLLAEVWGPLEGPTKRGALHSAVRRLQKIHKVIEGRRHPSLYRLLVSTDYKHAMDARSEGRRLLECGDAQLALEVVTAALDLWRGEPLAGIEPSTAGNKVDQLRASSNRVQEELRSLKIQALSALGRHPELLECVDEFITFHPFREDLHHHRFLAALKHFDWDQAYRILQKSRKTYVDEGLDFPEDLRKLFSLDPTGTTPSETATQSIGCLNNLPAAKYSEYVPRQELPRLLEGVDQALPVVAVTGIGGRGKRTLVHHFCTDVARNREHFDSVVWVSGKEPGSVTLSTVIEQLAVTTRHSKLGAFGDKRQATRDLLGRQRILIVIEAYENARDDELDTWLTELPPPSKIILTTIAYPETLREYCYEVELTQPSENMMIPFYTQLLKRRPIEGLVPAYPALKEIWDEWCGNYKLLEWIIGQLPDRSLAEVRESLNGVASSDVDVVLTTIFRSSWSALTTDDKRILLTLACYPHGVQRPQLMVVSGSPADFSDRLKKLQGRFFVKGSGIEFPIFTVDPLVSRKIREPTLWNGEDATVYQRWLQESIARASQVGFCPTDVGRLNNFDVPGVRENLEYAISWAFEHKEWQSVVDLGREMRYYYYVRGLWSPETDVNLLRAEAARRLGDFQEEFDALVYKLNIFAKQGDLDAGGVLLTRIETIFKQHKRKFSEKSLAAYRHAKALHLDKLGNLAEAAALWRANIKIPDVLGDADYSANLRWYSNCLIRMGGKHHAEGRALLLQARNHAKDHHFERALLLIDLWLAGLDLEESPSLTQVAQIVEHLEHLTEGLERVQDLRYTADHHHLLDIGYTLLGSSQADHHRDRAAELDRQLGLIRPATTSTFLETR